jgi:hypothetical protein
MTKLPVKVEPDAYGVLASNSVAESGIDDDSSREVQLPLSVVGEGNSKAVDMSADDSVSVLLQMWSDLDTYREEGEKVRELAALVEDLKQNESQGNDQEERLEKVLHFKRKTYLLLRKCFLRQVEKCML